ncbi:MAG: hypothetical protein AABW90_01450 [Nanoarchaeota archaeon]
MKKENKLFLNILVVFLFIVSIILIAKGQKIIQEENLKGSLYSLIGEDDGGWGEWENRDGEEELLEELEDISNENIWNLSLELNVSKTNVSGSENIKKDSIETQKENIERREFKQDYKDSFLGKKRKISLGEKDYEFTAGFYISIFLIVLVLGIISFWVYSFLKKKD